jgi:glycosyltransferase involved in cell wall biosynthesis
MKIALLTTDNRAHLRCYALEWPIMPPPQEALLDGFGGIPELEVHVISCTQRPMKSPEKLAGNIWFHLLHVPKIGWLRTAYQGCIRAVRHKLRELKPDIVHGQGTERECALCAVLSGFPNVVTIHGNMRGVAEAVNPHFGTYLWCAAFLERLTLPRTQGVFCNSAYTESMVRPIARRTWRVPNAIRREFFDASPPTRSAITRPIFLNVGTISPHKRQCEILELAEKLHREGHLFALQFIGPAESHDLYAASFLDRIEHAHDFARYLGTKSLADLIAALDQAAALIHAPAEEAFGLVVAEALARNLKVFVANTGGLPDIVAGIEAAELVDNFDALESAISRWLKAGCPRPITAIDEMRLRFHPDVIAKQHVDIYQEVLSRSS